MPTPRNWCLFGGGALLGAALALRLVWPPSPVPPAPDPAGLTAPLPAPATQAMGDAPAVEPASEATRTAHVNSEPTPAPDDADVLAEIAGVSFSDDPFAVRRVAAHLRHPAPAVRTAAREALRAAGDPAAVPELRLALDTAAEADEAIELADLIAYLQLPTYTELRQRGHWPPGAGAQRTRVAAGVPVKPAALPAPDDHAATPDGLAALRRENERLRLENQRLRAQAGLAAIP